MYKITTLLALLFSSNLLFSQAVGTPFIFETYKAPYVYQNIVTSYDGSSLSDWINGYGPDNQLSVDANVGNPAPSFYGGPSAAIRSFRRDFGQSFKNKTIEFDIRLQSGKSGFAFGCDINGDNGVGITLNTGTSSTNGLLYNDNWFYTNNSSKSYTFSSGQWYAIKIETGDGAAGAIKWYVDGVYQGTNDSASILGDYGYFGTASSNAVFYIDNIKITY